MHACLRTIRALNPCKLLETMVTILVVPDSFKGSAESSKVAAALSRGWASVRPDDLVRTLPFADGGEGTLDVIYQYQPHAKKIFSEVHGADGSLRDAYWLLLKDGTAVVELAQACGITWISELDPLGTHTYGLGELLAQAALHPGVKRIYIALGGSASTDAGVGALMALGYRFLDEQGASIKLGGRELSSIATIISDGAIVGPEAIALVDVQSKLLGPWGAAQGYGPQKGASAEQIEELNQGLENFLRIVGVEDFDGAGAAGGTAYGLSALWGARIESGAEFLINVSGLQDEIEKSDLIITGEGQLDETSFEGKAVGKILTTAHELGSKVALCVGTNMVAFPESVWSGISLTDLASSRNEAIAHPEKYLYLAGAELARRFN